MSGLLLAGGCAAQSAGNTQTQGPVGKCLGVNSCKGHSDCASKVDACNGKDGCQSTSACAGHNSCKGKGFKKMTKKECNDQKGKFEA